MMDAKNVVVPFRVPQANTTSIVTLRPRFDIISELTVNRNCFTGGEPFTVSGCPHYVRMSLDRLRNRTKTEGVPGIGAVISCCIEHGLQQFTEKQSVVEYLSLRLQLYHMENIEADLGEVIDMWFRGMPMSIPDTSMSGVGRISIRMPEELKVKLYTSAGSVGLAASALAIVCVLESLQDQNSVLIEHRQQMRVALDKFMRRLQIQRVVGVALLKVLREGTEVAEFNERTERS